MPAPNVPGRRLLPALLALFLACGDDPSGPAQPAPGTSGPLAAPSTGNANGTFGAASLTMPLHAASTMSLASDNEDYCAVTGTWTVAAAVFTASGRDCAGNLVTLTGSGTRNVRLRGTWNASTGASGSFD